MSTTRFSVVVEMDHDAWILNYGTEPFEVRDDIRNLLTEYIEESLNSWIAATGNVGRATVESSSQRLSIKEET